MSERNLLISEAAVRLGIPESTLRAACNKGVIQVPRVGTIRVFPFDRLDEFHRALTSAGYKLAFATPPQSRRNHTPRDVRA